MTKLPPDYLDKLDFMYQVMRDKLDEQNDIHHALGNKVNYLFAFTGGAMTFYLTFLFQFKLFRHVRPTIISLRMLGIASLLVVFYYLYQAAKTRKYISAPKDTTIYSEEALRKEYWLLKSEVIYSMKSAYNKNEVPLQEVASNVNIASILLFVSICIMVVSILL